ncbi:hypothetical protein KDK77_09820 [bacterium]|nr:hypothetical protein [bacterium]MCP5462917.1 hypothetical protein [bacterium]
MKSLWIFCGILLVFVTMIFGCRTEQETLYYEGQTYDLESLRNLDLPQPPEPVYMDNE